MPATTRDDSLRRSGDPRLWRRTKPRAIERRAAAASPPPWKAFLASDGGVAGSSVIWVSDRDDEPDMYLWLDGAIAPDADFEFVAAVRQDVPRLLEAVRNAPP